MNERTIRTGVIGLGSFGRHHVRHMAAQAGAVLTGVCDADAALAQTTAETHGCDVFAAPSDMIGKVDAVSIAAPATVHHRIAAPLLDAGVHVLVEKPLATTTADGADLIARARRSGVVLHTGHVERFSPAVIEMKRRVLSPRRIACIRHAPWTGRSGDVDVVLDMMIHDIDHALQLAGGKVVSITAEGRRHRSDHMDEVEAWLTFDNGAAVTLSANRAAEAPLRRITVTSTDVHAEAELAAPTLQLTNRSTRSMRPVELAKNDNLGDEIAAFLAATGGRNGPSADGEAGLAALEVALRIQAAMAETEEDLQLEYDKT